jgi:hypothetical protein
MRDPEVQKAFDLIRSVIDPIAQPMLDQVCIEVAGKSQEEAEAEFRRIGEALSRLMKQQQPQISDAVAFSIPRVFIEMARERLAMMPSGGTA